MKLQAFAVNGEEIPLGHVITDEWKGHLYYKMTAFLLMLR
jgi:hypothetical protein